MQLGSGRRVMLACGILVLLAALPYLNSLGNSFVWDDQQQIIMNQQLRAGADWSPLFSAACGRIYTKNRPGGISIIGLCRWRCTGYLAIQIR